MESQSECQGDAVGSSGINVNVNLSLTFKI